VLRDKTNIVNGIHQPRQQKRSNHLKHSKKRKPF